MPNKLKRILPHHERLYKILIGMLLLLLTSPALGQKKFTTLSGIVKDSQNKIPLPFVNVILRSEKDSAFVTGSVTDEEGRYTLSGLESGSYFLRLSYTGYVSQQRRVFVGSLSEFLELPTVELKADSKNLAEVVINGKQQDISHTMDKKTYSLDDNPAQMGGSVLQAMQNLPSVTVQDGKVQLRGSEKIVVLIDGKQTAVTGMGSQSGLDNIAASAVEKIEILNNPSSKFDANGTAGIINIILKKGNKNGFNGKVGLTAGVGNLWVRKENLPSIRPQYTVTPKINPSLSLNYRKKTVNIFIQADNLYKQTLNKNEFVTRTYSNGNVIRQQLKRNRNTNFFTSTTGVDCFMDGNNTLTVSGLFSLEKITDRGDQPFFNSDLSQRLRLWQFLEDELKTTVMATAAYQHKFKSAGQILNLGLNYTFHRENEKYYYSNYLPNSSGVDSYQLLSDEQVFDFYTDYIQPLKYGRVEVGFKMRNRSIPVNMDFKPGFNSILDTNAGGWATYKELIPALYSNYIFERPRWEAELGLRVEYVKIDYDVNPNHNTYKSNGYDYMQPFPNLRVAYKINDKNKLSLFYNRRVDRPNEVDIRIFPKYDDAEIIKVGNPALRPQFTNSLELGYKTNWQSGYFYSAVFHRFSTSAITRISTIVPNSQLIYAIFQNAGKSFNSGVEIVLSQNLTKWYSCNLNGSIYRNQIDSFTVHNLYPVANTFSAKKQTIFSGNLKLNNNFRLPRKIEMQLSVIYLAPDIIPQGRIDKRFSLNLGVKKPIQKGKGELFLNANDILNTMLVRKDIVGNEFSYVSTDYYETQVIRLGYNYKL